MSSLVGGRHLRVACKPILIMLVASATLPPLVAAPCPPTMPRDGERVLAPSCSDPRWKSGSERQHGSLPCRIGTSICNGAP